MKITFINYNGIKEYARVMYNDVKNASDKVRIDVCYNGKDIKALLEYLFEIEDRIDEAIEYCEEITSREIDTSDTDYDLGQDFTARDILNILRGENNE